MGIGRLGSKLEDTDTDTVKLGRYRRSRYRYIGTSLLPCMGLMALCRIPDSYSYVVMFSAWHGIQVNFSKEVDRFVT